MHTGLWVLTHGHSGNSAKNSLLCRIQRRRLEPFKAFDDAENRILQIQLFEDPLWTWRNARRQAAVQRNTLTVKLKYVGCLVQVPH